MVDWENVGKIQVPKNVLDDAKLRLARELCGMPMGITHLSLWVEKLRAEDLLAIWEFCEDGLTSVGEPEPELLCILPDDVCLIRKWWCEQEEATEELRDGENKAMARLDSPRVRQ